MAKRTEVAEEEREQEYREIDRRYRDKSLKASELAAKVEKDTGIPIKIDPKARPVYRGEVPLENFSGKRTLSLEDIKFCMLREFLPFSDKIWVEITESNNETMCTVIIKSSSYKAFVIAINNFFKYPKEKVSAAKAVAASFLKFCNSQDKLLGARAQASFFDKKEILR